MKNIFYLLLNIAFVLGCKDAKSPADEATSLKGDTTTVEIKNNCGLNPSKTISNSGIDLAVYDFENLAPMFSSSCNPELHVINFWATWCKPCVAELPYFEQLAKEKNIKVTLVSLDMINLAESKLIPYVVENKIKSKVVLLDDPDANAWIPKVSEKWSGAIPATVIINENTSQFYEQSFTYESLVEAVNTFEK